MMLLYEIAGRSRFISYFINSIYNRVVVVIVVVVVQHPYLMTLFAECFLAGRVLSIRRLMSSYSEMWQIPQAKQFFFHILYDMSDFEYFYYGNIEY